MQILARQVVSIDNISELGTIGVDVKERIIEATLMGDIEKVDTIVREVKESARPQKSSKGKSSCKMQRILDNVHDTSLLYLGRMKTIRQYVDVFISDFSGTELTAQMKHTLATRVNTDNDLRELGIMGFGVDEQKISTARTNNKDINEAARVVISTWSDEYDDPAEAFEDLCKILRKIKKNAWIKAIKDVSE